MKRFQRYASLITVLLAVSGSAFGQTSSTSLQGTVSDPSEVRFRVPRWLW